MENATLLNISELKRAAIALRASCADKGESISHSQALERIAMREGYRDWNTLSAVARRQSSKLRFQIDQAVEGRYLGHAFKGKIVGAHQIGNAYMRVSIHLDEAIDVVKFSSFSSWRKRISGTLDGDGVSVEKCSENTPHLVVYNA